MKAGSSKPLLTVCLITYNHGEYIREALDSILIQEATFAWQIAIADDCSTDGTREILLEYKGKFPERIELILQKKNLGPEANWLDLISYPSSKYVLYAEGDDFFTDPNKLQLQVDFLESHPDFSMCFHPVQVVYEGNTKPNEIFPLPEQRFNKNVLGLEDLLKSNFIQTNSVMYRWRFTKERPKDVFPKNMVPGDWFLHLLHAQNGKIKFIDRVMATYRKHPGGLWWLRESDEFWCTYGQPLIKTYEEVLRRFCDTKKRRQALQESISFAFRSMENVSTDHGDVLAEIAGKFPAMTAEFMRDEQRTTDKNIKDLQELQALNGAHIEKLETRLRESLEHVNMLDTELKSVTDTKAWKTISKLRKVKENL